MHPCITQLFYFYLSKLFYFDFDANVFLRCGVEKMPFWQLGYTYCLLIKFNVPLNTSWEFELSTLAVLEIFHTRSFDNLNSNSVCFISTLSSIFHDNFNLLPLLFLLKLLQIPFCQPGCKSYLSMQLNIPLNTLQKLNLLPLTVHKTLQVCHFDSLDTHIVFVFNSTSQSTLPQKSQLNNPSHSWKTSDRPF